MLNLETLETKQVWSRGGGLVKWNCEYSGGAGSGTSNEIVGSIVDASGGYGGYVVNSPFSGPPEPGTPTTTPLSKALDALRFGLDIAGLVPGIGEIADGTSAIISLSRGNYGEAMVSAGAMVPVLGIAATTGKFGSKAAKAVANNAPKLDNIAAGVQGAADAVKQLPKAPPALPLINRPHGSAVHDAAIMDKIAEIADKASDIRKNQTQVNALGEKISNLRPDLQWIDLQGRRHYYQVINSNPETRALQLLTKDPSALVEIGF